MAGAISVKINLSTGQLEVESPEESLGRVFEHLAAILPELRAHSDIEPLDDRPTGDASRVPDPGTAPKEPRKRRQPQRRPAGDSAGGNKRMGTPFYKDFVPFDIGIGDAKEIDLTKFFADKKPTGHKGKVLVVIYKLSELLKRNLSYDDIFQGLRIVGEPSPPKNMSAVVGELVEDNFVSKEDDGVRIKVQGSDFVDKSLPKKSDK